VDQRTPGKRHRRALVETALARVSRLRVLFMSGYTAEVMAHHGVRAGARIVEKPFTRVALLRAVREKLDEPR